MSGFEFAVLGAGAMGSILGAHLARAGHRVAMVARGRRAEQIRRDGLRISGLADVAAAVEVITEPSQLHEAEVLIVAIKALGTEAALQTLQAANIGAAFSIQNGLFKNELLSHAFGVDRALGGVAHISGELLSSGEVLFTRNVNVLIGELTPGLSDRAQQIAAMIDDSGVHAKAVADVVARDWTKFVSWVGLMTMSLLTRAVTGRYLIDPDCALLLVRLVRELATLANAQGIALHRDSSLLPLTAILDGCESEAVAAVHEAGAQLMKTAPDHRVSSLQDLQAGRPLEIEETLGHALRMARRLDISMPLLETFYHAAVGIDRTRM